MLLELRIRNIAVIESAEVHFGAGLTVLSGETGAGKSIIVGAIGLLLGERASSEAVRPDADRASVEAVFDISGRSDITALLAEQGIPLEEELLILRREVAAAGRNRAWINGAAATASLVGEVGRRLIDLHGQHEHQTLLRPAEQRVILDAFGGAVEIAGELAAAHGSWMDAERTLADLDSRRRDVAQRADFLRFQVNEIEGARLRVGEEEELDQESRRLDHAEELGRLASTLHDALYAGEQAITSRLGELRRPLDQLLRIDDSLSDAREVLNSALVTVEELGRRMGEYASEIEQDPARLEAIRQRQDQLYRLRAKYGATLADVMEAGRVAREELDSLDRVALDRSALEKVRAAAHASMVEIARRLSAARARAAEVMARAVEAVLPALGMTGGRFEVVLVPSAEITANGAENIEFRIAVNTGFEPRPLARTASGGELSRIMLALKSVLAEVDRTPVLIFDEIDAGIGGRVAHGVAEQLRKVAGAHQVFVITHLPQIASRADRHFLVEKEPSGQRTSTRLVELDGDARVQELARLLGGDPESDVSLEHARKLLAG
jgi:DNA repair protein RecN (Recombination protein N)